MRLPEPLRLAATITMAALFAAACGGADEPDAAPKQSPAVDESSLLGSNVFQGEAALVNGDTIDLAGLAGQDLVLWFWAPW